MAVNEVTRNRGTESVFQERRLEKEEKTARYNQESALGAKASVMTRKH